MNKKFFLLLIALFLITFQGCYRIKTIKGIKSSYENAELQKSVTNYQVVVVGTVKKVVDFPGKRFLITYEGNSIWIIAGENAKLPKINEHIVVFGNARRFLLLGDVCIKSHKYYNFIVVISIITILIMCIGLSIVLFLKKKHQHFTLDSGEDW